jgi:hypothetical protein
VLDVACGRAEVLRRVAERCDVEAMGYDSDAVLIEAGPPGLDLQVRDSPPRGPFDVVLCIAASHALGGFPGALGGRPPGRSRRRGRARARTPSARENDHAGRARDARIRPRAIAPRTMIPEPHTAQARIA